MKAQNLLTYLQQQGLVMLRPHFLDSKTCTRFLEMARNSPSIDAEVETYQPPDSHTSPQGPEPILRKTRILELPSASKKEIIQRLEVLAPQFQDFFRVQIQRCEQPHFLKYSAGDYFAAHRDYHDAPIYRERKISLLLFLNQEYTGGELLFFLRHRTQTTQVGLHVPTEPGLLLAFNPRLLHEVKPVLSGERYSIVTWLC